MTAKARLLLVEDTPSTLHLYHEVLARLDVVLIDADTGAGALTVLREMVPDVVLLDLELPDINGVEILREIKRRGLPSTVIVVTAHGSVKTAVEAMREGAYDFIVKPFAPDDSWSRSETRSSDGTSKASPWRTTSPRTAGFSASLAPHCRCGRSTT